MALVLVFLILGLAGLIAARGLASKFGSAGSRAEFLRAYPAATRFLPLYWEARKLSDITYLPFLFKKDKLPTYALEISDENLQKLNDSLPQEFMTVIYYDKIYVPAKFSYQGKEYDVQVRYRGDTAVHWNAPKRSYHVRFNKDMPFFGFRELAFIIADDRKFVLEHFHNYRAGKLGLLRPPSFFANLRLNGQKQGLYFVMEGWSQEMLAKWEVPDEANLYGDGDVGLDWKNLSDWELKTTDTQFTYQHFSEMKQLLELLNHSSDEEFYAQIFDLIDKDDFYSWQVLNQLANSVHGYVGNIQLYFDDSNGKFHFVPWDVEGDPASVDNFEIYGPLATRIFANPVFFHEKNKRLYEYLADEKNLQDDLRFYNEAFENIQPALYRDRLKIYTNRWADGVVRENRANIIANAARLKEKLEQAGRVLAEIAINHDNSVNVNGRSLLAVIDLHMQSIADYYLTGVEPKFAAGPVSGDYELFYDANGNDVFDAADLQASDPGAVMLYSAQQVNQQVITQGSLVEPQNTRHRFYLASPNVRPMEFAAQLTAIELNLENAITGKKIKNNDIEIKLLTRDAFRYFRNISDADLFERENPMFRVNQSRKEITLPVGTHSFNKTVVVPKGFTLRIAAGTTLRLGPDTSIMSYSPVAALGTALQPISVIRADPNRPWGTFAVLNAGAAQSEFRFVRFQGGKDAYLNGVFFIGMVSIYHSDLEIADSEFSGSQGDDGLNVKNSQASIVRSRFVDNGFDGLDLDFIKHGLVSGNTFLRSGNDGLDLSGSGAILIERNTFQNSGDKCISIGERSVAPKIFNNLLDHCLIGIEVKDGSTPAIINNLIVNNEIGIKAYVKKPVYGGGTGYVYNSIIWNNGVDFQTDVASRLEIYHSNFRGAMGENHNFSTEPPTKSWQFASGGDPGILEELFEIKMDPAPVGLIR